MASRTQETDVVQDTATNTWFASAIAGLLAGVVMGAMMQMMMTDTLAEMIPALYGLGPGLAIGWSIHLFHSLVFGLVYAAVAQFDPFREYAAGPGTGAGIGLVYGIAIWIVAASFVMPAWIGAVTGMSPAVPTFNTTSLVGHAVFGIVLGVLYPVLVDRL